MNASPLNSYVLEVLREQLHTIYNDHNTMASKLSVSESLLRAWLSGTYNFSLEEVQMIEDRLEIKVLSPSKQSDVSQFQLRDFILSFLEIKGLLDMKLRIICNKNNLYTLDDLIKFKIQYDSFTRLTSNNTYYNRQLINLCQLGLDGELRYILSSGKEAEQHNIEGVESNYTNRFRLLSVRARNALNTERRRHSSFGSFYEHLKKLKYGTLKLKNVGEKTEAEILKFIHHLEIKELNEYSDGSDAILTFLYAVASEYKFELTELLIQDVRTDDYHVKILRLLQYVFDHSVLIKANYKFVLQTYVHLDSETHEPKLDDLGDELNITRERVRQLKLKIYSEITRFSDFIRQFSRDFIPTEYQSYIQSPFVYFGPDNRDNINQVEGTSFSTETIITFLAALRPDTFLLDQVKNNHFLIVTSVNTDQEHIETLLGAIHAELHKNIYNESILSIRELVSKHTPSFDPVVESDLAETLVKTFSIAYGLMVNTNGDLRLPPNSKKNLEHHIEDILNKFKTPLKLNAIVDELKGLTLPDEYSEGAIRSAIYKSENIITISKSGTYALKSWESAESDIRGGTILDICHEYLSKTEYPTHIYDIYLHVKKYRNTSAKSIATNLKLDTKKRFTLLGNEYYGLSDRVYDLNLLKIKPIGNHLFGEIKKLILEKRYLPLSELETYIYEHGNLKISQVKFFIHRLELKGKILILDSIVYLPGAKSINLKYL